VAADDGFFLFRPPDLFVLRPTESRFVVLVFFVALRAMALGEKVPFLPTELAHARSDGTLLSCVCCGSHSTHKCGASSPSKYIVPFALFHVAGLCFRGEAQRRHFAVFVCLALAYLYSFPLHSRGCPVAHFPRFILDEAWVSFPTVLATISPGGPNGVSLNILGILVLALPQKRKDRRQIAVVALPVAILATMTRAVWIAFAFSAMVLDSAGSSGRVLAACALLAVASSAGRRRRQLLTTMR